MNLKRKFVKNPTPVYPKAIYNRGSKLFTVEFDYAIVFKLINAALQNLAMRWMYYKDLYICLKCFQTQYTSAKDNSTQFNQLKQKCLQQYSLFVDSFWS